MKKILYIILCASLFACNRTPETKVKDLAGLRPSEIFNRSKVAEFIMNHANENKKLAASYFSKGEQLVKSDPDEAIWNYKRAITLNPTLDYYHALGELLIANKNYADANSLYSTLTNTYQLSYAPNDEANYLFGKSPSEEDIYNNVLCQVLQYNAIWDQGLYTISELGYDFEKFRKRLLSDERLNLDTASIAYKSIVNMLLSDEEVKSYASKPENFRVFLSAIKDTAYSYAVTLNNIGDFIYKDFEIWDDDGRSSATLFRGFLAPGHNDWFSYNLKNTSMLNDSVRYVIYSVDTSEYTCPKPMRHITYTLVTYTNNGKLIEAKNIAWQSGESLAEVKVSNGFIDVKEYKRRWKQPYHKADFSNELISNTHVKTYQMQIMPDGKIAETLPSMDPS